MMCLAKETEIFKFFDFDKHLYFKEVEIMKKNKEKLTRSLQDGEKKIYKLFKQKK